MLQFPGGFLKNDCGLMILRAAMRRYKSSLGRDEGSEPAMAPVSSWLEIDLCKLASNVAWWRQVLQRATPAGRAPAKFCAVVKADAYGMGAGVIAKRVLAAGAQVLAVYDVDQAHALLNQGVRAPILLFMPARPTELSPLLAEAVQQDRLLWTVASAGQAEHLHHLGRSLGHPLQAHLQLDSGMSRGGLDEAALADVLTRSQTWAGLRITGLWTHMAAADNDTDFTHGQLQRFEAMVASHRAQLQSPVCVHAAATYSTLRGHPFHRDMIRIGIGLHGYGPAWVTDVSRESLLSHDLNSPHRLQPTLRWVAPLIHVSRFPSGRSVGYNRTVRLSRDSILGIVPVGYADGYPLALSNRGSCVAIGSPQGSSPLHAPVLGRVNMDQIVIDLTDIPSACVRENMDVEVISSDPGSPCSLERLATLANSSCYEMLSRLSGRLPRVYLDD